MWPFSRSFLSPPCTLRRVIVNTTDPTESFQAVLWSSTGPWLTLKDVLFLKSGQPAMKLDGDVVMHRDKVTFFQVAG